MMKITTTLTLTLAAIALCQCSPYQQQGAAIHEDSRRGRYNPSRSGYQNPPPRTSAPRTDGYPLARRTSKPNQVISPYPPHNVIDVRDFKSGDLARDPGNQKIFRVP